MRQGSDGSPDVWTPLDRALQKRGLPLRVECHWGLSLSTSRSSHDDRAVAEREREQVIERLVEALSKVKPSSSGTITIGTHSFHYEPSAEPSGYVGGGTTAAHVIDQSTKASGFLEALRTKALQQSKRPPEPRLRPFVVAYDNRDTWLLPRIVRVALTGSRYDPPGPPSERPAWLARNPHDHPRHVREALAGPWAELLEAWDYGAVARLRFERYGALVEEPWAAHLSAVLVTHVSGYVQWFPNPFASPPLQEPKLLQLGLPIVGLKPMSPAWRPHP